MADFYVNIDNSYSATSGNGTSTNPFNISQFTSYLTSGVSNSDTFNIKGYYSNLGAGTLSITLGSPSSPAISATNVSLKAWDAILYGPWKVEADLVLIQTNYEPTNYFSNLIVRDFVVSNFKAYRQTNPPDEPWYFRNGLFRSTTNFNSVVSSSPIYIQGCTLAGGVTIDDNYLGGFLPQSAGIFQIDDCVFYNAPLSDNYTKLITFNSCVFSGTSAYNLSALQTPTSAVIQNDCTFSWNASASLPNISDITSANRGNLSFESFGLNYSFTKRKPSWTTALNTSGFYGTNRRGPGAFNFTNNVFYVNLAVSSVASATSGAGTSANPFLYNDVFANNNGVGYDFNFFDNDVILMRGKNTYCGNIGGGSYIKGITMDAWNISAYGPWILANDGGLTNFYCLNLKNGMIFTNSGISNANMIENMYIYGRAAWSESTSAIFLFNGIPPYNTIYMRGSTVVTSGNFSMIFADISNPTGIAMVARDSIFAVSGFNKYTWWTTPMSAVFDNVTFQVSAKSAMISGGTFSATSQIIDSNCQYNWTPPTLPIDTNLSGILADRSSFKFSQLGRNITISGSSNW